MFHKPKSGEEEVKEVKKVKKKLPRYVAADSDYDTESD